MSGVDHIKSKREMSLTTEAMEQLQMKAFLQETDVSGNVNQIQSLMKDPIKKRQLIWEL